MKGRLTIIVIHNNTISNITNLLDNTTNQPSKFRTGNWVEINDESKGRYHNSNIRFKTSIVRSNVCDYSDAYILVKGSITVPNMAAAGAAVNDSNEKVILTNCPPFTDWMTEINNTQVDDAHKIDAVMPPMYNLIEYNDAYSNTASSLCQYCRDEPTLNNNDDTINNIDFPENNNS